MTSEFPAGGATVKSNLGDAFDGLIAQAISAVVSGSTMNFRGFSLPFPAAGTLKGLYSSGFKGLQVLELTQEIHKLAMKIDGVDPDSRGLNVTYLDGINSGYYDTSSQTREPGAPGWDTIYITTQGMSQSQIRLNIIHEILHESKFVNDLNKITAELVVGYSKNGIGGAYPDLQADKVRQLAEHVQIASIVEGIRDANGWSGYSNLKLYASLYFNYVLKGVFPEKEVTSGSVVEVVASMGIDSGALADAARGIVLPLGFTEDGLVTDYMRSDLVTVSLEVPIHPSQLGYVREITDSDGNVTATVSLAASLRIFLDLFGFDGRFGIDNSLTRPGERAHGAGNGNVGAERANGGGSSGNGSGSTTGPVVTPGKVVVDGGVKDSSGSTVGGDKTVVVGYKPILLDLNGNGVEVAGVDRGGQFVAGEDGLLHRTSWAGTGDGVLFFDAGMDGQIKEAREYVFTEWDPTAKDDMAALRGLARAA